jgi:hypothetical protein
MSQHRNIRLMHASHSLASRRLGIGGRQKRAQVDKNQQHNDKEQQEYGTQPAAVTRRRLLLYVLHLSCLRSDIAASFVDTRINLVQQVSM